ncbi:MAG: hypothetical protein ACI4KM_12295 [Oscillospiraceae bacterium]
MLLKTALRNLQKNPVSNIICLIQLSAVFLITAVMVSAMSVRYRTYEPVRDILESNGVYCMYSPACGAVKPGGVTADIRDSIFSVEELREYLQADSVITIQTAAAVPCAINGEETDVSLYKPAHPLFYDDELLSRYKPELKSGRWISKDSEELEVVIPEGMYGADIGDTIDFWIVQVNEPKQLTARVVGILKDGTEILGRERFREEYGDNYRLMYKPYYLELEEGNNPVMLASSSALNRLYPNVEAMMDSAFFLYDDMTEEETARVLRNAAGLSPFITIQLSEMNANSKAYLREQLLQLLPIVVVLLILVIVSSVSVSAISARQRLTDYAKFYILGLRWKQCAAVNFFQSLVMSAAALAISVVLLAAAKLTPLSDTIMIIINPWLALALPGILALYLAFSMIMPLLMIGTTTPKQLLQEQSGG